MTSCVNNDTIYDKLPKVFPTGDSYNLLLKGDLKFNRVHSIIISATLHIFIVCEKVNAPYVDGMLPVIPRSDDLIPSSNIIPSDITSDIDTLRSETSDFWASSQEKPYVEIILNDGSLQREVMWISIPDGTNVLKYRVYSKDTPQDGYEPKGVWHIDCS